VECGAAKVDTAFPIWRVRWGDILRDGNLLKASHLGDMGGQPLAVVVDLGAMLDNVEVALLSDVIADIVEPFMSKKLSILSMKGR
jgi:hypothetical protein